MGRIWVKDMVFLLEMGYSKELGSIPLFSKVFIFEP